MLIKVYFDHKPLFLASSTDAPVADYLKRPGTIMSKDPGPAALRELVQQLQEPGAQAGIWLHTDPQTALEALKAQLVLIQAAGGLVHTDAGEVLLIFRRGKWDLPKGKLDEGEDLASCALREIEEETGLGRLSNEGPLCITYHTYHQDGQHVLKESHWFLVKGDRGEALVPQTDEDIEACVWVEKTSLPDYMEDAQASVIDVWQAGMAMLS